MSNKKQGKWSQERIDTVLKTIFAILGTIGFLCVLSCCAVWYSAPSKMFKSSSTPQVISTSTPKPRPRPTVVPEPALEILPNSYAYESTGGYPFDGLYILGEVRNNTDHYVGGANFTVTILDSNEKVLSIVRDYSTDTIAPGGTSCFSVDIDPVPEGWSHYTFGQPEASWQSRELLDMEIYDDFGQVKGDGGYKITGKIRSNESAQVERVLVIATLYNDTNQVVGCDSSFGLEGTDLVDPGQEALFEIYFGEWYREYWDVTAYHIKIVGHRND